MKLPMWDVIVGGRGPAGLVSAARLVRAGRKVLVLAPDDAGRQKIGECVPGAFNGLLGKLSLPRLGGAASPHHEIGGVVSLWAGELRVEDAMTKPGGGGWRLDRAAFERELADATGEAGATFMFGRIRGLGRDSGGEWRLELDDGRVLGSRFLVDGTGRNAAVASRLGARRFFSPPLIGLWAVGRAAEAPVSNRTMIESVRDGWWYAAFLPDRSPLAIFHTTPAIAAELRSEMGAWEDRLTATRVLSSHVDPTAFRDSPLCASDARSMHLARAHGPGWAACGDAAMSFDPLSSQGIFNAVATAEMLVSAMESDGWSGYEDRLNRIRGICTANCRAFYQSAALHYGTGFWRSHADSIQQAE